MKNYKKIIFVNLIILIIVLILIEVCSYTRLTKKYEKPLQDINKLMKATGQKVIYLKYRDTRAFNYRQIEKVMRKPVYKKSNKKPIVLFGCSFTYGYGLEENQTFSQKLADASGRTVYNRGWIGTGTPFMYYQLNRKDIKKEIPDAEYIIYTFMPDHFYRLLGGRVSAFAPDIMLSYKIKNGKLIEQKPLFLPLHSLFTVINIEDIIHSKKNRDLEPQKQMFDKLMLESFKLAKLKYPNAKFIILLFDNKEEHNKGGKSNAISTYVKTYNQKGFVVIPVDKLLGHKLEDSKYYTTDGYHPSETAWNEIVPKLVKNLNL